MKNLSVVISAFNEDKKIRACLESVKELADEIVFIDNSSTDTTAQIAAEFTTHVYTQKNDPLNIDLQKNIGFEKATGKWILYLDADETVSQALAQEIKVVIAEEREEQGFLIPRKNKIFGKWMEHTGWYPDYQLRLFKRGQGKYEQQHVHEGIQVKGTVGKFSSDLLHANYESVTQFFHKHMKYAENEAAFKLDRGHTIQWTDVIRMPAEEFISRYFARKGYRDGFHGLVLSLLMGFYHLMIFTYMWEKKKFADVPLEQPLEHVNHELRKVKQDISYWMQHEKIAEETNPLKKTTYKIMKKIGR